MAVTNQQLHDRLTDIVAALRLIVDAPTAIFVPRGVGPNFTQVTAAIENQTTTLSSDLDALEALLITIDADTDNIRGSNNQINNKLVSSSGATVANSNKNIKDGVDALVIDVAALEVNSNAVVVDLAAIEVLLAALETLLAEAGAKNVNEWLLDIEGHVNTLEISNNLIVISNAAILVSTILIAADADQIRLNLKEIIEVITFTFTSAAAQTTSLTSDFKYRILAIHAESDDTASIETEFHMIVGSDTVKLCQHTVGAGESETDWSSETNWPAVIKAALQDKSVLLSTANNLRLTPDAVTGGKTLIYKIWVTKVGSA